MEALRITSGLVLTEKELQITTARSSGPGGQNVNKVNTKATLRWNPSQCTELPSSWKKRFLEANQNRITREVDILLQSDRYRDQKKNIHEVRQRLVQLLLACQHPPKTRRLTKPTKGSQRRRLQNKREHSEKKARRQGKPDFDWKNNSEIRTWYNWQIAQESVSGMRIPLWTLPGINRRMRPPIGVARGKNAVELHFRQFPRPAPQRKWHRIVHENESWLTCACRYN